MEKERERNSVCVRVREKGRERKSEVDAGGRKRRRETVRCRVLSVDGGVREKFARVRDTGGDVNSVLVLLLLLGVAAAADGRGRRESESKCSLEGGSRWSDWSSALPSVGYLGAVQPLLGTERGPVEGRD